MNDKVIIKNLIALIKVFSDVPELFAKKMLEHDVFNEEFLNILSNNASLSSINKDLNQHKNIKKVFYSIEDINKFYDKFFKMNFYKQIEDDEYNVYSAKTEQDVLIIQLEKALETEDYVLADKINTYMKLLNINYTPSTK